MATYKMDGGAKNQFVFDKNLHLLHTQNLGGNLATLFANKKPKPAPISKKAHRPIYPREQPPTSQIPHVGPYPLTNHVQAFHESVSVPVQPVPVQTKKAFSPAPSQNEWQIQWKTLHHAPRVENGEAEDAESSDVMDMSSGPDASEFEDDAVPDRVAGRAPPRQSLSSEASVDWHYQAQDMSDNMDLSSGPDADDDSDDDSPGESMSITQSKGSRPSSHTSTGVINEVQNGAEQLTSISGILKPPSRSSSLSSQLSPAKSTTPAATEPLREVVRSKKKDRRKKMTQETKIEFANLRPRTSIPQNLSMTAIAQQGIHAAFASRLNPFALHPDEHRLLKDHICHLHVTAYLNIRNRILRLWVRNPLVSVTAEEAAGCALASRWLGLAEVAYEWLLRRGYINFGCVEIPEANNDSRRSYKLKKLKKKQIVVIGAGMSGLGCARQLEGLLRHYRDRWTSVGDEPPNVVVLEGRNRIGGRVYSHPFKNQNSVYIADEKRCTAEMGAHIIVGFEHGNPLSILVRGQLALPYYALKNDSIIHDTDGNLVDEQRDQRVEALFNDILDRASVYRHRTPATLVIEGDRDLIEAGRDPQREGGPSLSAVEEKSPNTFPNLGNDDLENVPGGIDKLTGKAHMIYGSRRKDPPAMTAEAMGWKLASNVLSYQDLNLDVVAKASKTPTLGAAMDEAVKQYQFLLDLSPDDMRLLNWHYANLEYANAANVGKLSLGGWDQDAGNEFEGTHAQVVGGYQQVPRGLLHAPTKLDVRTRKAVQKITYNMYSGSAGAVAKVDCEDGDTYDADYVILTSPLGVLKQQSIAFDPPLPEWKMNPINRLGFGTLNKIVLAYDEAFWPLDQDMFGLLREPKVADSLHQEDYVANRGRFYFFWNCIRTSGRPVLIALMAGDAAHEAEGRTDADLIAEVTQELVKIFKETTVPRPAETIITRWGKDRFARGSYSYVGAASVPGDYEAMATPYGNLHFAGEATCATHPATVHGAYISGLRAASEVIDDLLGPIEIPNPLVPWPSHTVTGHAPETPHKRKSSDTIKESSNTKPTEPQEARYARLEAFESEILQAIYTELGLRPSPPPNSRPNAFLLYTSEKWAECKAACEEAHRLSMNVDPNVPVKTLKNEVRAKLGSQWNALSDVEKRPYHDLAKQTKFANLESAATFDARLAAWDSRAIEVRREYVQNHPGILSQAEEDDMWKALGVYGDFASAGERKAKKMSGYADRSPM